MDRRVQALILLASIGLAALTVVSGAPGTFSALVATDLAVGLALGLAGFLTSQRRPRSRAGFLLALTGCLWLLGSLLPAALYLHRVGLAALFLSYPAGTLTRRRDQALIVASIALNAALPFTGWADPLTPALGAVVAVVVLRRARLATGPARRASISAGVAAMAFASLLAAGSLARSADLAADGLLLLAYEGVVTVIGLGLAGDLLWGRWSQAAVTGLMIDLGESGETGSLRDRLAIALGDPSLLLGYWIPGQASYVDAAGRPVELPAPGSGRRATPILAGKERIGVLVHDEALVDDPALIPSVASAASLTIGNARLQAAVRDRMTQVAASRRRLVEAANAERRRIDDELDSGARGRLERIEELLGAVGAATDPGLAPSLAAAQGEVHAALADLRELVQATHPRALRAGGLAPALAELATRMPVPVTVHAQPGRYAPIVETTLYFVCSEALTNVAKHARASRVTVDLVASGGQLRLLVTDDGIGGADLDGGSGLRGLKDRVEALGGSLQIGDQDGPGTRLSAELPVDVREAAVAVSGDAAITAGLGIGSA